MDATDLIVFRNMTVNDLDIVASIDKQSFPKPWSKETFINELTQNRFATYILLTLNEKIVGYCGLWVIVDEAHITNIAVLPEYRGKKFGEELLKKTIELAKEQGALSMTLEVRVSNKVAQNLYEKFGFQIGGVRKNYYTDNGEDAYVMWVKFNEKQSE